MKRAVFTSTLVIEFDEETETPEEALRSYLGDNDVVPSYQLEETYTDDDE